MVPSLIKCIPPAILFVSLISSTSSSEKVAINCEKMIKNEEPCPSYCPKEFRPSSLNPTNLWGVPCVCCGAKKAKPDSAENDSSSEQQQVFQPKMVSHEKSPEDVPTGSRKKLLSKLTKLKELKKLPPKEFSFWEARTQLTEDDLLSSDEVELLISLLVDCGVSWSGAFFLVHPLAAEQSLPAPKSFGMRSGFGSLLPEKTFSLDDLREKLEDIIVPKVDGIDGELNKHAEDKNDAEEDGSSTATGDDSIDEDDGN